VASRGLDPGKDRLVGLQPRREWEAIAAYGAPQKVAESNRPGIVELKVHVFQ
jgi:hypothetical protein